MNRFITLSNNTFKETLRQPVYAIIISAALFLFIISPAITMYTMDDDNKLLREMCLSTLFLTGLFVAIFSACGAVTEEIESKTILTILSKPVRRPVFILSKFFGVSAAVVLAHYICTIAFLMATRHGVMETASDTHDWTVISLAIAAVSLALLVSAFFNYVYGWNFSSTTIIALAIFATACIVFLLFIDRKWQFNPSENGINSLDVYGSLLLLPAALIIIAIAVTISSRFNIMVTLLVCVGFFLVGLVSDYAFGRFADEHLWAKICWFVVPNFQVFWISDAIHEASTVTLKYIGISLFYGFCYTAGILSVAVALFQRRQVG